MGKVFLIQTPSIDRKGRSINIQAAAVHGDVLVVLDAGDYPTYRSAKCLDKVTHKLSEFNPDQDFLLWAGGDTLSAVMAGAVLYRFGLTRFRWLRFERFRNEDGTRDNDRGEYHPIWVNLFPPTDDGQLSLNV